VIEFCYGAMAGLLAGVLLRPLAEWLVRFVERKSI